MNEYDYLNQKKTSTYERDAVKDIKKTTKEHSKDQSK